MYEDAPYDLKISLEEQNKFYGAKSVTVGSLLIPLERVRSQLHLNHKILSLKNNNKIELPHYKVQTQKRALKHKLKQERSWKREFARHIEPGVEKDTENFYMHVNDTGMDFDY